MTTSLKRLARGLLALWGAGLAGPAWAMPPAPAVFCAKYPQAPACSGARPACAYCHVSPPLRNELGAAIAARLAPSAQRPLAEADFAAALPEALAAVEALDSDGDGASNLVEIQRGSLPADARSFPRAMTCGPGTNPVYQVCQRDWRYLFRKVVLDFCGHSPTYEQLSAFVAVAADQKPALLDQTLDACLESAFWRDKNGQLWEIAHRKVRPVGTLKQGEDRGNLPLADYYDDYALFAWSQLDDNDARAVLTADFFVARTGSPARYTATQITDTQYVDRPHRAGVLTSTWSLVYNVMFTALPRNAASQAYRSYLGLDIAKQEGLFPVAGEPKDYDGKDVTQPLCTQCHATLDPLSYPFRNYNGLSGLGPDIAKYYAQYVPGRIETFFAGEAPAISQIPEQGWILGQPVSSLREWAQVAADSDAFAAATVMDYWKLLLGAPPTPEQHAEFTQLWRRLKTNNQYSVKKMLHELVQTEAYGAP